MSELHLLISAINIMNARCCILWNDQAERCRHSRARLCTCFGASVVSVAAVRIYDRLTNPCKFVFLLRTASLK